MLVLVYYAICDVGKYSKDVAPVKSCSGGGNNSESPAFPLMVVNKSFSCRYTGISKTRCINGQPGKFDFSGGSERW